MDEVPQLAVAGPAHARDDPAVAGAVVAALATAGHVEDQAAGRVGDEHVAERVEPGTVGTRCPSR